MKCTLITIIFAIFVSVWARAEDLESNKGNNLFLEKAQDLSHAVFPEKPEKDVTAENNKNLLGKKEEQDHGLPEHSDIQRDREVRRYKRQNPVPYETVGCFKDRSDRAVPTIEGHDPLLDGYYGARKNAIEKCYRAAKKRGFQVFAVQHGGWCATSAGAEKTFDKYGRSSSCKADGEGGPWANQVYYIKDYSPIGCYKDTSQRAIQTREGHDAILDGNYWLRKHAIAKCAVAARRAGYTTFAVQDGGWCATSATAEKTFDKYGRSYSCDGDGEGGPWANQVYYIRAKVQTTRVTIRLTITNYSNHAIRPVSLTAPQGTTAFQLLQLAARRNPCYRFKYKWCGIGRLITSICCVDQDPKAKLYWLIYINGKLSPVGVDLLKPKAGDRLTFKYQKTGQH